jgi:hypothetical protein
MMTLGKKFAITAMILPLLAVPIGLAYLAWPLIFPKYKVGSCVRDAQVHRILRVEGTENILQGGPVAVTVLVRGDAGGDSYAVGSRQYADLKDSALSAVACP